MAAILVWDLPTRVFHWLFFSVVSAALGIALAAEGDSDWFPVHMLCGLGALGLVCLRLVWGVFGSRYARFTSFIFSPSELVQYLRAACAGKARRHTGHNPGSAYGTFGMLLLSIGLGLSGIFMGKAWIFEALHKPCGYLMLVAIVAHIVGLALHTWHHKENISLSMIHGCKEGDGSEAIASSHPWLGLIFLLLGAGWALGLWHNYDTVSKRVSFPLIGTSLVIGDSTHSSSDVD